MTGGDIIGAVVASAIPAVAGMLSCAVRLGKATQRLTDLVEKVDDVASDVKALDGRLTTHMLTRHG